MSTDLSERLAALADRAASAGSPASGNGVRPAELWQRGRRRQVRRALAATVAVAVVSTVAGIGGATAWQRIEAVEPVTSPDDTMRLPDHLYAPSPWLDGTDEAGPIGPMAAVMVAQRRSWFSASTGIVGVSAASGEYRFVDLPGWPGVPRSDELGEVALSPDGRFLAYWHTGPTTREVNLQSPDEPVIGAVGVYDAVTGEVSKRPISTSYGVAPWGMAWTGEVLHVAHGSYSPYRADGGRSSHLEGMLSWDARTSAWTERSGSGRDVVDLGGAAQGVNHAVMSSRGYSLVGRTGVELVFRTDTDLDAAPVPDPTGERVAGVFDPDPGVVIEPSQYPIVVSELGVVDDRGRVVGTEVPEAEARAVVGWRDATHVVTWQYQPRLGYYSVDIRTGGTTPLTAISETGYGPVTVAAKAWQAPVVATSEPDQPMDPRVRALLIALAVTALWITLLLWRRRGHA